MKKRILSLLLAIVMVAGLLPLGLMTTEAEAVYVHGGAYIKGSTTFNEELFKATRTDFRDESVYTLLITRFNDGDSSNNIHCWDDGMAGNPDSDPAWRGDFKGLIEKLDYIRALGFTAIRLTPVAQNASSYDYHGYHAIDMKKVDFRFESDGYTYQDLIDACHQKEMKVMQEVVLNDTSSYGEEFLGKMFDLHPQDYVTPEKALTPTDLLLEKYPNYASMGTNNQIIARLEILKGMKDSSNNPNEYYHRESTMGYESPLEQQGQIALNCVDINTENPIVAEYLAEVCRMYARKSVDAICIVNAKQINRWTLNEGILPILRQKLENDKLDLEIFYEVVARAREIWNCNIPSASVPFYSWAETEEEWIGNWDSTHPTANIQTSIDHYNAHLDPSGCPTSNNALLSGITYHTPDYSQSSGMHALDFTMMWNYENADSAFRAARAGDQYMNDATWNLLSIDSIDYGPDGMEKTRYSLGAQAWAENLNLMFTFRGIPSVLYGTEIEFQKGMVLDVGPNAPLSQTGRAYYGDHMEGTVTTNGFIAYTATGTVETTLGHPLAHHIRQLNAARMSVPALRKGQYTTDGRYVAGNMAFIKRYTDADLGIDSLALVSISGGATFKNIPNGKYRDVFTGDIKNVTNGTLTVSSVAKGNMAVYVCEAPGFTGLDAVVSGGPSYYDVQLNWNDESGTIGRATPNGIGYVQLPESPASSEYPLKAWRINGVNYQPGMLVKFSEETEATAIWNDGSMPGLYTVTLSEAENGAVSVNQTTAEEGQVVTLTVTLDAGYELDTLTVTDASGNPIAVTGNKFVMPASDVMVTATFKKVITYTVTVALTENGRVIAVPSSAKEGAEVILHPIPADGYELDTLTVTDASGNSIVVTANKFVMPAAKVTVTATFKASADSQKADTIYFDNTKDWEQVKAYAWRDGGIPLLGTWPGTAMTKVSDTLYSIKVPEGTEWIIFSNDGNNQTEDLLIPTDGSNLYSDGAWLSYPPTQPAEFCFPTISLEGNIAINYYMRLSDAVLSDAAAYMQFTMADGETIRIPVSEGVQTLRDNKTYYVFSCAVNAKEMTDDVIAEFFYYGGSTGAYSYSVQTYAHHILEKSENENMKALATAMLYYGAAAQHNFAYHLDKLADDGMEPLDYTAITMDVQPKPTPKGTDLVSVCAASLIMNSENDLRFYLKAKSEDFTVSFNGQLLEVKKNGDLYYVDVVGIAAKDLDEAVTIIIDDGTDTAEVSYSPMTYCSNIWNNQTGKYSQEMKNLTAALYLYNQAANNFFAQK